MADEEFPKAPPTKFTRLHLRRNRENIMADTNAVPTTDTPDPVAARIARLRAQADKADTLQAAKDELPQAEAALAVAIADVENSRKHLATERQQAETLLQQEREHLWEPVQGAEQVLTTAVTTEKERRATVTKLKVKLGLPVREKKPAAEGAVPKLRKTRSDKGTIKPGAGQAVSDPHPDATWEAALAAGREAERAAAELLPEGGSE